MDDEMITNDTEKEVSGETKAEKFTRLATARTNKLISGIDSLGKLSGSSYEYTEEQVDRMFTAIRGALDDAESQFKKSKKETKAFSF